MDYSQNSVTTDLTVDATAQISGPIEIAAKSAILMEKSTGKILYAVNENEKIYPASVTKIMSILLVCEAIDSGQIKLSDSVTCSANASSKGGSQIWLEEGETMTVEELLKATCIYSANDACTLLGEYVSGSEQAFVDAMNKKAQQLGMSNTHFDNCTGLDDTTDTHLTSALDVAIMSRELLRHDFIKKYTTIWIDSLRNGETQLVNTNKLIRFYKGITGLKTGTTEKAGCCVSATAMRDGMELIAVVLGSENSADRFDTAENLLDYGFANYEIIIPDFNKDQVAPVKVAHGKTDNVSLKMPEIGAVLVNKGQGSNIKVKVELPESVEAPVENNVIIGKISVSDGENIIAQYDIMTAESVARLDFLSALYKLLTSFSQK
ncbi:MAG: D-alanyl-D-alanine carboxypeptidase [Clostridia bacterium]|nr:D-alanyl-D-alanine carboxypeptidase [Clostridia bacterium]